MKVYLYIAAVVATLLAAGLIVKHIQDGVKKDVIIDAAATNAKVEEIKSEIRNKPTTGDTVLNRLSDGSW